MRLFVVVPSMVLLSAAAHAATVDADSPLPRGDRKLPGLRVRR